MTQSGKGSGRRWHFGHARRRLQGSMGGSGEEAARDSLGARWGEDHMLTWEGGSQGSQSAGTPLD